MPRDIALFSFGLGFHGYRGASLCPQGDGLLLDRKFPKSGLKYFVANAWAGRRLDRTFTIYRYPRLDDVLLPISCGGGYVAGQGEARQGRHSDIVSTADPGFEH